MALFVVISLASLCYAAPRPQYSNQQRKFMAAKKLIDALLMNVEQQDYAKTGRLNLIGYNHILQLVCTGVCHVN